MRLLTFIFYSKFNSSNSYNVPARSQLVLGFGLNILTSINALAKGDQRFLALTSSRAPGVVFEPCGSFSPVSGPVVVVALFGHHYRLLRGFRRIGP